VICAIAFAHQPCGFDSRNVLFRSGHAVIQRKRKPIVREEVTECIEILKECLFLGREGRFLYLDEVA
jgi:hypothetical protein